jgi:thioredoxin reductase (NADPH)
MGSVSVAMIRGRSCCGSPSTLGVGVFYAATQAEAQACGTGPVAIVGGGNSAGQAALFLSRSCVAVHLIIRRDALNASMSRYLVDRIERNRGIVVWPSTQVTALTGTNHLEAVRLRQAGQPEASELAVTGLFVFIGAKPGTGWLAGQLAEDRHGFLLTGTDIPATRLETKPDTIVSGDQQARHIRRRRRAQRLRQARRSRHR